MRKPPKSIIHGGVHTLTADEIRLEVRDIMLAALRRLRAAQNSAHPVDYKLDMPAKASVHATR